MHDYCSFEVTQGEVESEDLIPLMLHAYSNSGSHSALCTSLVFKLFLLFIFYVSLSIYLIF
jgi:hypothetical protein